MFWLRAQVRVKVLNPSVIHHVYLEYFAGFEETRVLLAAEREQDVQADSAPLLLQPGAGSGVPAAGGALPAGVLDQALLAAAARRRLRGFGLHACGCGCVCVSASPARGFKSRRLDAEGLRKCTTCVLRHALHIYGNKRRF